MRGKLAVCAGLLLLGPIAGMAKAQAVYPQAVYPQTAYPQAAYPQTAYPQTAYPQAAYPQTVSPPAAYPGAAASEAVLPPYEIMSIVRRTGLAPLSRPMRRGPYYVLVAVDRVGRQMRVVVDAQLGDIVNLRPALAGASYGPDVARSYGPPPVAAPLAEPTAPAVPIAPRLGSDNALAPAAPVPHSAAPARAMADTGSASPQPRSAPNPRPPAASSPATRTAVAEPPSPPPPPLPRPRPHLAANEAPASPAAPATPPPAGARSTAAPARDELIE